MTTPMPRPATVDGLFLWVLHRFAEVFEEHAVVKGGIALRLFDCPRSTTDIDYVFVPFRSKAHIRERIEQVLLELKDAKVDVAVHSNMVRATLQLDDAAIQIEANVDMTCATTALPTAGFATRQGQPSRIVRVMEPGCALAHKLAAWNERRLLRDLYDAYFLSTRLGFKPDWGVLDMRLARIESRLPSLKKKKRMSRGELAAQLRTAIDAVDDKAVRNELMPILPANELVGLLPRMRSSVVRLAELLDTPED